MAPTGAELGEINRGDSSVLDESTPELPTPAFSVDTAADIWKLPPLPSGAAARSPLPTLPQRAPPILPPLPRPKSKLHELTSVTSTSSSSDDDPAPAEPPPEAPPADAAPAPANLSLIHI